MNVAMVRSIRLSWFHRPHDSDFTGPDLRGERVCARLEEPGATYRPGNEGVRLRCDPEVGNDREDVGRPAVRTEREESHFRETRRDDLEPRGAIGDAICVIPHPHRSRSAAALGGHPVRSVFRPSLAGAGARVRAACAGSAAGRRSRGTSRRVATTAPESRLASSRREGRVRAAGADVSSADDTLSSSP